MDNDLKTWLYDILNAIMEIDSFFTEADKQFSAYQNDVRTEER